MILIALFASLYGLLQLGILGSAARSITWRHAILAFVTGASASAAIAISLEQGLATLLAHHTGSFAQIVVADSYRFDPIIEETCKILPVTLLLLIPHIRRSLGFTDILVLSAASGTGFGFTEAALGLERFQGVAQLSGGFLVMNTLSFHEMLGPLNIVTSWIPGEFTQTGFGPLIYYPNDHLIWTALLGFGVALSAKLSKWRWMVLPIGVWTILNHGAVNAERAIFGWPVPTLLALLRFIRGYDGVYVAAVLLMCVILDRLRIRRAITMNQAVLIAEERDQPFAIARLGFVKRSDHRFLRGLWSYVLERRAYLNATITSEGGPALLAARGRLAELAIDLSNRASQGAQVHHVSERKKAPIEDRARHLFHLAFLILLGLPALLLFGLKGSSVSSMLEALFATAAIFAFLKVLLLVGLISRVVNIYSHVSQLTKPSVRLISRAVLDHGLGTLSASGSVAMSGLAMRASLGRGPLALIFPGHSIEYWLTSDPLTVGTFGLGIAALSSFASPDDSGAVASSGEALAATDSNIFGYQEGSTSKVSGSYATPYLDKFGVIGDPVRDNVLAPASNEPELLDTSEVAHAALAGGSVIAEPIIGAYDLSKAFAEAGTAWYDPASSPSTQFDVATAILGKWAVSTIITGAATAGGAIVGTAIEPVGGTVVGGIIGGSAGSVFSQTVTYTIESNYGDATRAGLARATHEH